jgi:histidine triad (HIT) family protein
MSWASEKARLGNSARTLAINSPVSGPSGILSKDPGLGIAEDRSHLDDGAFPRDSWKMKDCIFCKIVNREAPSRIISEDENVIVFVSRHNDPLVVPKKHIENIYGLDDETGTAIVKELVRTAKAVKSTFGCEGVYITQASEPAAGQDVFHLHFHVYPRWKEEAKNQVKIVSDDLRRATMEKIEAAYR